MVYTKLAYGLVMANFLGVFLVELAGMRGVFGTKPALIANSTFMALSMTSTKLFWDAVKSIS